MQLGLTPCGLCPRRCGVSREKGVGFCGASPGMEVSSVCIHRGEEPPIAGLVNVFFTHCNLHCIYCQNHVISDCTVDRMYIHYAGVESIADRVAQLFPHGNGLLGLVTAAHYVHQIPALMNALKSRGISPTVVYNSSGYETVSSLQMLEGLVDIYIPDLKYMDSDLACSYSHAPDYPEVVASALGEMRRQVGASLKVDDVGTAFRGMIVRHLILPGHIENSLKCLDWLALNFPLSTHISLMSQYYPPRPGLPSPLDRTLTAGEYEQVVSHFRASGFTGGWLQELSSEASYRPDFSLNGNPFEPQI